MKVVFYYLGISLLFFIHINCTSNGYEMKDRESLTLLTARYLEPNVTIVEQIINKVFEANDKPLKCQQRTDVIKQILTDIDRDSLIAQIEVRYVTKRLPDRKGVISCGAILHDSLLSTKLFSFVRKVETLDKIVIITAGLEESKSVEIKCEISEIIPHKKNNILYKNVLCISNKIEIDWPDDVYIKYYVYLPLGSSVR